MPALEIHFVLSAPGLAALPPATAEVAVAGRSNVGKSSLINAMANRKRLAQVSKTPGRTRLLNLYAASTGGTVVDLPGYGYAAAPARDRARWPKMIESYLLEREHLEMVLVLVDGAIGPTALDITMLTWLRSHDRPHTVIATKLDKVRPSRRGDRRRLLASACSIGPEDVMWVSATQGTGIEGLRSRLGDLLAPPPAPSRTDAPGGISARPGPPTPDQGGGGRPAGPGC